MTVRAEPFWRESQWLNLRYLYISNSQPVKTAFFPSEGDKDFKVAKHTDWGGGGGGGRGVEEGVQILGTRETERKN